MSSGLADAGFDVFLVDGKDFWPEGGGEERLKDAVAQARLSPHALPGKVGVFGCSLGGASALSNATRWRDEVAAVVVQCPTTSFVKQPDQFVAGIALPPLA